MICPNCSTEIPNGLDTCPVCQTDVSNVDMTVSEILTQNIMTEKNNDKPKEKKGAGAIIGIIAAILVIAAIVACILFLPKNKYDGRYDYVLDSETINTLNELDMTPADLGIEFYLEIKGKTFTMVTKTNGAQSNTSGSIKFNGSKVTFYDSKNELTGTYNKKDKIITISFPNSDMQFKKTE